MNKNYIDITKELLKNVNSINSEVKELMYFIDKDGNKYNVDGKNVVLDYSSKEKSIAEFIVKTFGETIFLIPRINIPWGIKTPDYLWNNEYWDLKEIKGSSNTIIDNAIKHNKEQCNNFIIDCTKCSISTTNIIKQTTSIFQSKYRLWVNKIMIIKNKEVLIILKRK